MRFEGRIKTWNEERAFGFIEPDQGGQDIFCHITALPARAGRPTVNSRVSFEVELNREGKKRARAVQLPRAGPAPRRRRVSSAAQWGGATLFAVPAFVSLYLVLAVWWRVPNLIGTAYVILSVLCFGAYAADKSAANAGHWRKKECSLLMLGLSGGWPGGILAQQLLRHKSLKVSFRRAFWGTVWLNVAMFVALSSPMLGAWRWLRWGS
jgi:uncharacterized membrane protein YsdA (DUF1294 family)/cold shock CspA family protein